MRSVIDHGFSPFNRILALGADTFSLCMEGSFLLHGLLYFHGSAFVLASAFCDYIEVVRLFLSILHLHCSNFSSFLVPVFFFILGTACYLEIYIYSHIFMEFKDL